MPASFKIVHLSDLHFGENSERFPSPVQEEGARAIIRGLSRGMPGNWIHPATHSEAAARAVGRFILEEILEQGITPDLFLVTGDIGATGSLGDLSCGLQFLGPHAGGESTAPDGTGRLVTHGHPILAFPGNHDRYQRWLRPGGLNYESVFAAFWNPVAPSRRVASRDLASGDEVLSVVTADFSLRFVGEGGGGLGYIGRGKVHDDVLADLVAVSRACIDRGAAVVWALHFPPSCPDIPDSLTLLESDKIKNAATELDIRLIFAGHTHRQLLYRLNNISVSCAGSATQADATETWAFSTCGISVDGGQVVTGSITPISYVRFGTNDFVASERLVF